MSKYNSTPTIEERFAELVSRIRTLETAPRLPASSIGSGGMRVKDGGNIVVEAGGNISVLGNGNIISYAQNGLGYVRFMNGVIHFTMDDTEYAGSLVASLSPNGRSALYVNPPNQTGGDATKLILEGESTVQPGNAWLLSNGQISVSAVEGVFLNSSTADVQIYPASGFNTFIGHTTTSAAGNTYLNTNGAIQRSTSSLKYKRDVEEADIDVACVLKLVPKTWRDRAEVENDPDTTKRYIGFIAEDLHEAGLTDFVVYEDGEPDAISYDRLAAGLIVVIKSQEDRIKALEEKINGTT